MPPDSLKALCIRHLHGLSFQDAQIYGIKYHAAQHSMFKLFGNSNRQLPLDKALLDL